MAMRLRRRWVYGVLAVAIAAVVVAGVLMISERRTEAQIAAAAPLTVKDFSAVRGTDDLRVPLDGKFKNVAEKLGKPSATKVLKAGATVTLHQVSFEGLTLQYAEPEDTILAVEITGTAYHTPRGIKVGDNERTVLETYGKPTYNYKGNLQYVLTMHDQTDRYQLTFVLSDGKVQAIWSFVPVQ